ncbi:MAG: lipopolysaccharide biosynthesis protein [SAR324 cluster bacterium]|nr:lipopolysaccharide biosynthesis protein [SAR324 cluster bacterium]
MPFTSLLKREVKNVSVYTTATFSTSLLSFLLLPLYWKKLTPTDYGIIAIAEMLGSFSSPFLTLFLDQSLTRFYYEWNEVDRKRKIGGIWVLSWLNIICVGGISIFLLSRISPYFFPEVDFYPYLFLGLTAQLLGSFDAITFATIRIKNMPKFYTGYSLLKTSLLLGSSILFVLILDWGLYGYFVAQIISSGIIAIMALGIMFYFATPAIRNTGIREALKYSLPLIPNKMVTIVGSFIDRYMLQQFASVEALGIYAVSMKFANLMSTLHSALKLAYGPFLYQKLHEKDGKQIIAKMTLLYVFPLFFTALSISVYIDEFVKWINQPAYFQVVKYVPYVVLIALMETMKNYYTPGIVLAKKTHLLLVPSLVCTAISIVGSIIFVPLYQTEGVIIVRFIESFVSFMILMVLSLRVYEMIYSWRGFLGFWGIMLVCLLIHQWISIEGLLISTLFSTGLLILFVLASFLNIRAGQKHLNALYLKTN